MPSCTYDGKGDPKRYVAAFESHMLLYTDTNAVWCKVFPTTLTGAASDWFSNLEPGSIDCFETLVELFTGQYISNSARQRTSGELMQEIVVMALMNGLGDNDFKKYMSRKSFPNLGVAFAKAHEYIKSEELLRTSRQISSAEPSRRQSDNSPNSQIGGVSRALPQGQQRSGRPTRGLGRYSSYTQLNTPRAAIYSINQNREDWSRPTPMITKGRDVRKYCMFHRDIGHYTEECVQLKENIEDLIRKGRLSQYRTQAAPSRQQNSQPRQTEYRKQGDSSMQDDTYMQNHAETSRQGGNPTGRKITIDVITGGPVYGGSMSGAKKSYRNTGT
ncbi:uncharacterized protein LOC110724452 [Chenopodium quinoa]|uniref:uncharacterized protein LOC110724452 n=1 Tax=Chenopodium quinoa TaxID=63459 RepID=UPI000B79188F|nr:uncharacterized protein LOC110724452 [Chenopodium quinoa]